MQVYVLFAIVVLAALPAKSEISPEAQKYMMEVSSKCAAESGVADAVLKDANEGKIAENDPQLKQFALCFAKTVGFMNDAGDIMMDHIKQILYANMDKNLAETIINKCMEKKATPLDTAFEMGKCMQPFKDQ